MSVFTAPKGSSAGLVMGTVPGLDGAPRDDQVLFYGKPFIVTQEQSLHTTIQQIKSLDVLTDDEIRAGLTPKGIVPVDLYFIGGTGVPFSQISVTASGSLESLAADTAFFTTGTQTPVYRIEKLGVSFNAWSESALGKFLPIMDASGADIVKGNRTLGDTAYTGGGNDTLKGYGGADSLFGMGGNDILVGGNGNDKLSGGNGQDTLRGDAGNDFLSGGNDDDKMLGGTGKDRLEGGSGNDTLAGGGDADVLFGEDDKDSLSGGTGGDRLYGGDGEDTLKGGNGHDLLNGGDENDVLLGERGNDKLFGGTGDDLLTGGPGKDRMHGDAGADLLQFSAEDVLWGGADNDVFKLTNTRSGTRAYIEDWTSGEDQLQLPTRAIPGPDGTILSPYGFADVTVTLTRSGTDIVIDDLGWTIELRGYFDGISTSDFLTGI